MANQNLVQAPGKNTGKTNLGRQQR
jgi:hypothetical protein